MKSTPKSCMKGSRSCGPRPSSGFRHRAASCTCGRGARLQLKFDLQVYASSFAVYFSRAPVPDTIPGKMVSLVGHAKRNLGHTTVRSPLLFLNLPVQAEDIEGPPWKRGATGIQEGLAVHLFPCCRIWRLLSEFQARHLPAFWGAGASF